MPPRPRRPVRVSDINRSVGQLQVGRAIVGLDFDFEPTIGLVAKAMDRLGTDIQSFREPLTKSIQTVLMPSIAQNFSAEGRPEPWEPLAPYTVERRNYQAHPILKRTGTLKKVASSFNIWTITKTSAVITSLGSRAWYGSLHQAGYGGFGAHINKAKKALGAGATQREVVAAAYDSLDEKAAQGRTASAFIPARPFIMMQDEDVVAIQAIFFEWLSNRVDIFERGL